MAERRRTVQLWQIMVAIGILAGLFAVFGVTFASALLMVAGLCALPVYLARPQKRLSTSALVASAFPALFLVALYATWFAAWSVLGHMPRVNLDDPKFIGPGVRILHDATLVFLVGWPAALVLAVGLHIGCVYQDPHGRFAILASLVRIALPFASLAVVFAFARLGVCQFDYIMTWFMD